MCVCYGGPGACCIPGSPDYTCTEAYEGDCQTLGGTFQGSGTTCDTAACCPPLRVDYDSDGDVDMKDFGWFQACLTGSHIAPATPPCRCANLDTDDDVDQADFDLFHLCLSGPNVPVDPECLN